MQYININSDDCEEIFYQSLKALIENIDKAYSEICVACIGTDRSTGDSLGPLVGYKLKNKTPINIVGNLDSPLHAKNLNDFINSINENALVITVDACLGQPDHVGHLLVGKGSINPGAGVGKNLSPIGDIHINGIVNYKGTMDFIILQNTRLSLVMKMADIIAGGLEKVFMKS